ncbi:MAG TPA: glycosyltransferase family 1 protein [Clostridiales bacterium UBA9856]|jgi:glycosyltransferase involved in cell wall biosynthesis|nr:glycosyltransferase family 1 protein [Clostridiales bacterium UBA9856]
MMRQIVCISTSNYYPVPTRKQNVMNRLQDAEVIYIDPPVTILAPLKDRSAFKRLTAFRKPGQKAKDNITVYSPPLVFPFFNKYRWINRINQKMIARYIRKRMKEHGFTEPYLWCYTPTSCDLIHLIPNRGVIYDCVDRHSAYKGMIDPVVVDAMEKDLATAADQVFCTAAGLYDTLRQYNENTELIPNGVDYELFSRAAESPGKAAAEENKPVFGFVGMLQECIDYQCMEAVAQAFPEGELVLVGRSLPGVDLSSLRAYPNVRFMGLVPQAELPEIIAGFDVCLNLFKEGRLSKDVSPLKFYEYLATGKPIVSTREPLQVMDYADVVYIAENREDFVVKCREALQERDPSKVKKRMEYGKACSWDKRVQQMEQILLERGIFE